MSNSSVREAVLNYLKTKNRPYSANDIATGLQNDCGKGAIQKALEDLVAEALVMEKTYGKQKVFAPIQTSDSQQNMKEAIETLDREIDNKTKQLSEIDKEINIVESQLKSANAKMTIEEALKEEHELQVTIQKLESKLEKVAKNAVTITKADKDVLIKTSEYVNKEYKKRKRICMDISNAILETYPKPKKAFFEEVGIEPDE